MLGRALVVEAGVAAAPHEYPRGLVGAALVLDEGRVAAESRPASKRRLHCRRDVAA